MQNNLYYFQKTKQDEDLHDIDLKQYFSYKQYMKLQ